MRRLKSALLVLVTLLLVAAGAAMPGVAAYVQDAYGLSRQEDRSFDSFSLTLREETDLGRTLRLIEGSDYYIEEAQQADGVRMTRAEVLTAAEELMKMLIQFGLLEQTAAGLPTIWPQTLCANDGSVSIPTWSLSWSMPDPSSDFYVWLDDASGKAFLISLPSVGYSTSYIIKNGTEPVYVQAENWRAFLEEYYGTEVTLADEMWFDYSAHFTLTFLLGTAENEAEYRLVLDYFFTDGFTNLNPYVESAQAVAPSDELVYDS